MVHLGVSHSLLSGILTDKGQGSQAAGVGVPRVEEELPGPWKSRSSLGLPQLSRGQGKKRKREDRGHKSPVSSFYSFPLKLRGMGDDRLFSPGGAA